MKDKVRRGGGRNQPKTGEKSLRCVLCPSPLCASVSLLQLFFNFFLLFCLVPLLLENVRRVGDLALHCCSEYGCFHSLLSPTFWPFGLLCILNIFTQTHTDINLKVSSNHFNKQLLFYVYLLLLVIQNQISTTLSTLWVLILYHSSFSKQND